MKNVNNITDILKINYEETIGLFSSETLNAMQMAQVIGGGDGDLKEKAKELVNIAKDAIKEVVTEAITEIGEVITKAIEASKDSSFSITTDDGTEITGTNADVDYKKDSDGNTEINISGKKK